jgi:hypothetical protein
MKNTPIMMMAGNAWTPARFWLYRKVPLYKVRKAKLKGWCICRFPVTFYTE